MDQQELTQLLRYDPLLGIFTWKVKPAKQISVGDVAGHIASNGYVQIRLEGVLYYAHRLAFLYMTGVFPVLQVDHINGDTTDTRWSNLREVSQQTNQQNAATPKNNTSGVVGVTWDKRKGKWMAKVMVNYKTKFLGYFDNISDAAAARKAADVALGFHSNHGRSAK